MKEYLKEIFQMEESGGKVKTTDLAKRLRVKPASTTEMVSKIAAMGLLVHIPYHGVRLTEEGRKVTMKILRKHRLLEKLFVDFAGLDVASACEQASKLELLLSDQAANSICVAFNHPTTCPCGKPIYSDERCCGRSGRTTLRSPSAYYAIG